jgi:hypothetical protein
MNNKTRQIDAVKPRRLTRAVFFYSRPQTQASRGEVAVSPALEDRPVEMKNRIQTESRAVVRLTQVFHSLVKYLPAIEAGVVVQ